MACVRDSCPLLITNEGKWTHRRGVCVSVTVVYRKVGHPGRRYGRITGCSRKQGLLSVQHSTLTLKHRCPENLKPTTNHTLKNHLLCLRWECVGLRTWDQIKTSKNIAWIVLFLWAQSCFGEAHTERPVHSIYISALWFVCFFFALPWWSYQKVMIVVLLSASVSVHMTPFENEMLSSHDL